MAKRILVVIVMVILAAGVIGWVVWNKPHPKAEDQEASAIAADSLYNLFVANEATANGQFLNKVLEARGTVTELSKNQDGQQVVILGVDDPLGGVQCTMRRDQPEIAQGATVRVKGFCNGITSVVLLSDCIIAK